MNPNKDYSLDDIQSDIIHLSHLIDETMSKLMEIDHFDLKPDAKHYVDRACAFVWVARDLTERIDSGFSEARRAALQAAKGARLMLSNLIANYHQAKAAWEAQFDEDDRNAANSPEWRRYMDLSCEIIGFRCTSIHQVREKAEFILTQVNLLDLLANGSAEANLTDFLKSLSGNPVENGAVDNVDNGEN